MSRVKLCFLPVRSSASARTTGPEAEPRHRRRDLAAVVPAPAARVRVQVHRDVPHGDRRPRAGRLGGAQHDRVRQGRQGPRVVARLRPAHHRESSESRARVAAHHALFHQGDRFGGALDAAARQFSEAYDAGLHPMEFVNAMRKKGELIMGIGHRVKSINNPDMRVTIIKAMSQCRAVIQSV